MPFKTPRRDQIFMLPPSVDDWVPGDHPVRFVWSFVEGLELLELGIAVDADPAGRPKYPPKELLAAWLYGFMDGKRSSRQLERACRECLP